MFNLAPLFLAAVGDAYQLTDRQIGLLAGVEIAGFAIASFSAPRWVLKRGYRMAASIGVAGLVVGNLASLLADSFTELLVFRLFTGLLGDGLAYVAAILTLGARSNPTRAFGLLTFSNMCFTGVALIVLPQVLVDSGWWSLRLFLALLGASGVLALKYIPAEPEIAPSRGDQVVAKPGLGSLALLGVFFFCINLGAVWAFAERIGAATGLDIGVIGLYLGLSMPFQALGSLGAALLSTSFGRVRPLCVALFGQLLALALLGGATTGLEYFAAVSLWGCTWNFGINYQLGQIAELPNGARLLALVPGSEAIGASIGPVIAGLLLSGSGYSPVILLASGGTLFGLGLAIGVARK